MNDLGCMGNRFTQWIFYPLIKWVGCCLLEPTIEAHQPVTRLGYRPINRRSSTYTVQAQAKEDHEPSEKKRYYVL